jgi:hypothetical protein
VSTRIGETIRMFLGVKLLQREALETLRRRSEHSQGGGRRMHYLDGAQRAVQSKGECTQADLEMARMRFGGIDKL